jgi:hypothetical protein
MVEAAVLDAVQRAVGKRHRAEGKAGALGRGKRKAGAKAKVKA